MSTKQLVALVQDDDSRRAVIKDCAELIESEVRSKKGLAGMAVKTAFAVVKAIKPGIVDEAVDGLLDEFIEQVQPFYDTYHQEGATSSLQAYLGTRSEAVAENLLAVTDRRAQRAKNKTLLKAYQKLRPKGKEHVIVAVPQVGALLDRHIGRL